MAVFLSRSCWLCRLSSKQPRTALICVQWFCTMALGAGPGLWLPPTSIYLLPPPRLPRLDSQVHSHIME